jgi:hypothetical protein
MSASQQYHGDVGVVVTGRAHIHQARKESALAPLEEEHFFQLTGIRASWQARVCLMFLIEFVDVQIFELRRVWGRELQFVDGHFVVRTSPYQKWAFFVAAVAFVVQVLLVIYQAQFSTFDLVDVMTVAAELVGIGGLALLIERRVYHPYRIAQRINADLPHANVFLNEALLRARLRLHALEESL